MVNLLRSTRAEATVLSLLLLSAAQTPAALAQPAFPGAQGFGAAATGGRGGSVLHVTTLAASGEGSFQWAIDQPGARIVVFDVSGVIEGDVRIDHGDLTIAGQTAPGAGITIHGHLFTPLGTDFGNMIIRYIRVRPGPADSDWPPAQHDAVQFSGNRLMILDHVGVSHGVDENMDLWNGARDVTIQWSTIAFPNPTGGHPEGEHHYCLINGPGGGRISIHHNLFAHCRTRTPAVADGPADIRNNVVFNVREAFVHHNPAQGDFNIVGNVWIDGPSARLAPLWFDPENSPVSTRYFVSNNWVEDPGVFEGRVDNPFETDGFADEYSFHTSNIDRGHFVSEALDLGSPITTSSPDDAEEEVLMFVGAFPRDVVDRAAVAETAARNGEHRNFAIDPAILMDGLTPTAGPADRDEDGMPDEWEEQQGLDPDTDDSATVLESGYTAIEEYINGLADQLAGRQPDPGPTPPIDGGVPQDAATPSPSDGGAAREDVGGDTRDAGSSDSDPEEDSGCAAAGVSSSPAMWVLVGVAVLWRRSQRRDHRFCRH